MSEQFSEGSEMIDTAPPSKARLISTGIIVIICIGIGVYLFWDIQKGKRLKDVEQSPAEIAFDRDFRTINQKIASVETLVASADELLEQGHASNTFAYLLESNEVSSAVNIPKEQAIDRALNEIDEVLRSLEESEVQGMSSGTYPESVRTKLAEITRRQITDLRRIRIDSADTPADATRRKNQVEELRNIRGQYIEELSRYLMLVSFDELLVAVTTLDAVMERFSYKIEELRAWGTNVENLDSMRNGCQTKSAAIRSQLSDAQFLMTILDSDTGSKGHSTYGERLHRVSAHSKAARTELIGARDTALAVRTILKNHKTGSATH
jgi:hypothetical protein